MHNLVLASVDQAWSFGGSILTFLLPMLAFAAVALALLVLYTKPELVPGRDASAGEFPITATRMPGTPAAGAEAAGAADADSGKPAESASAE